MTIGHLIIIVMIVVATIGIRNNWMKDLEEKPSIKGILTLICSILSILFIVGTVCINWKYKIF